MPGGGGCQGFDLIRALICGDFNLSKINWETPVQTTGVDEVAFTEQLNDFYLTQLNNLPTRGDNILDLVISTLQRSEPGRKYHNS